MQELWAEMDDTLWPASALELRRRAQARIKEETQRSTDSM
jgi:hypothetical protein